MMSLRGLLSSWANFAQTQALGFADAARREKASIDESSSVHSRNSKSLVLINILSWSFALLFSEVGFAQSNPSETSVSNSSAPSPSLSSAPSSPAVSSSSANPSGAKIDPSAPEASPLTKTSPGVTYPRWTDLTAKQQLALRPLLDLWAEMSDIQKRKWLAVSANFSDLNSKDQEKLQARMTQWSVLSPQQRAQARVIFAQVQQYQGDERLNKWQEYQALDPEKKSQLAQNLSVMPNSAAISPKPKAMGQSSTVYLPIHRPSPLRLQVDQIASKTLLPPKHNTPAP